MITIKKINKLFKSIPQVSFNKLTNIGIVAKSVLIKKKLMLLGGIQIMIRLINNIIE
jgi:hypothetical protein